MSTLSSTSSSKPSSSSGSSSPSHSATSAPKSTSTTAASGSESRSAASTGADKAVADSASISAEAREPESETSPTGDALRASFAESTMKSFSGMDADGNGFLAPSELKSAMGNEATAEQAAAAQVGLQNGEQIQGYSNDEWFRENDGPTAADVAASGEKEEALFQRELSRQKLRDGQQSAEDVPHGYDSVFGDQPTEQQKQEIGSRGVTTSELERAYRTEEEMAAGVTVVDREQVAGGQAQPGLDRMVVVSAPKDAEGRITGGDANSQGLVGPGTDHDDIFRLARAHEAARPGEVESMNKMIEGEPTRYVGPRSTYETNSAISSDQDRFGSPQFIEEGAYRGEATPLGSDISLDLGRGNNTVYLDQPINVTGLPAEHLTSVKGSPDGLDTYNFDEGLMTREVMPVDVHYNGESLFSLSGDQVESLDALDITQAQGGTSRFRVPTNRMPVLNPEHPLVQSGRLKYEGEYLVITR